jgi:hypothetical protein
LPAARSAAIASIAPSVGSSPTQRDDDGAGSALGARRL